MRLGMRHFVILLTTMVATAAHAAAEGQVTPDTLSPTPVFATIQKAWSAGDAKGLIQNFGRRKVFISLPDGGPPGGHFSRDQSFYILKDLFDASRTEEFTFVTIREPEEQRHTAFGLAQRTFRPRDAGRAVRDRVFVSLVLEDEHWVVSEIKSVR